MNRCPKCGREFEGKFCPDCGTQWEDEKICPECGAKLSGEARFCNECGYSFYPAATTAGGKAEPPQWLKNFTAWIKAHLKAVISVTLVAVLVIILACSIPACIAAKTNGTYYKLKYDGTLDKETYFILKSGKWSDEDGESGKYKKDGEKITFFVEFFGMTETIEGTLKDYVLTVNDYTYISEKHKHFSDSYDFNDDIHWQICSACGVIFNPVIHSNPNNCSVCGYPFFEYVLNNDKTAYTISGILNTNATEANIPATYKNLPVTAIGDFAFKNCTNLKSITIPNSVTYITGSAFRECSELNKISVEENNANYKSENNCILSKDGKTLISGCKNSIIPYGVTSIGDWAFTERNGLTIITIPFTVTSIGWHTFDWCRGLKSITFMGTTWEWEAIDKGNGWDENTGDYTVHCINGDISKAES